MKLRGISDQGFKRLASTKVGSEIDFDVLLKLVEEVYSHIGAAEMQLIPSDDQIIADHIRSAVPLLSSLWNMLHDVKYSNL